MPLTVAVGESASELLLHAAAMVSGDRYVVAALIFCRSSCTDSLSSMSSTTSSVASGAVA
jgi:hypothetical protein